MRVLVNSMLRAASALSLACLIIGAPFLARSAWASCDAPFSSPDNIEDFHLRLSEADWDALRASQATSEVADTGGNDAGTDTVGNDAGMDAGAPAPGGPGLGGLGPGGFGATDCDAQFPYFEAEFRCGEDEPWISIGIRRKRDRSGATLKVPIKLDFNRTVPGQRWPAALGELGYRKLTLNSGQPDESARGSRDPDSADGVQSALITEHLAWRLMKEELPEVSGAAYARVTLHFTDTGEQRYQGLHLLVESMDRTAVRTRYPRVDGSLFKTTTPGCVDKIVYDDGAPNAATDAFEQWLDLAPEDFAGSWYERTNEAMQLDGLLRQEALRELFANTSDTALGRLNNYFALDLKNGRRRYFPWDLDDMLRPQPQLHSPETPLEQSCLGTGGTCSPIPLGVNIRSNAELRPRYLKVLCQLTHGVAHESRVLAHLLQTDALVRPVLIEEVPVLWTPLGQDPLDASTPGTYAAELLRMQEWIPARIQAVRSMIEAEGVACGAGCAEGSIMACDDWDVPSQRVCTEGTWSACGEMEPVPQPGNSGGTGGGATTDPSNPPAVDNPTSGSGGSGASAGNNGGGANADNNGGGSNADSNGGANAGGSFDSKTDETKGGSTAPADPGAPASSVASASGCGCRLGRDQRGGFYAWAWVGLAIGFLRRRRQYFDAK